MDASAEDWWEWHAPYDDPDSSLSRRLRTVQEVLSDALDRAPEGTIDLVSMCAGQGHDVLGVLDSHPRRCDVRAVLVERDERNAAVARERAATLDAEVEVRTDDAGRADAYAGYLPAHVVLLCGVFGNITDGDIERTVTALPTLCAPDATAIWTRHRGAPDVTPHIREWFRQAGFVEDAFVAPDDTVYSVGAHHIIGAPRPYVPVVLFDFVGWDRLGEPGRP